MTLLTAVTATLLAATASAQPVERDHRRPQHNVPSRRGDQITVAGFQPQSGPPGTVVTITGTGFTPKTKVIFGGRPVRLSRITPEAIDFAVPRRPGDGSIVIRMPGVANDLLVGNFQIIADPVVMSFAPGSGTVGSRVEIRGSGFRPGDQALIGNRPMAVTELTDGRIVAQIPEGAASDFLIVARPNGPSSRSRARFQVVLPNPIISGFSPQSGPPGTVVRISGDFFTPGVQVFYGRIAVAITSRSERTLDVVVPAQARTSEVFLVRSRQGDARSAQPFGLEAAPDIDRFAPTFGAPGQRVAIYGNFFRQGDVVSLAGRRVQVVEWRSDHELVVEIPNGAQSGPFMIERGGTRTTSRGVFEVVVPPIISGFDPPRGEPGTQVTLRGSGFAADAEVFYGAQRLRILSRQGDTALVIAIPPRAQSQQFTVRTRGGEARSAQAFQVTLFATVTGISPNNGPVGTRVTLRGRNFDATDRFFLAGAELPMIERGVDYVLVSIPGGAQTGRIEWESFGRRFPSRFVFTVIQAPVIAGFTPGSGPPGTQVRIDGDNFTNGARVYFGNLELAIVRRGLPRQLVVVLPANASGTDYFWVEDGGARVKAQAPFQVFAPPSISGISPATGPAGTEVVITGASFTQNTIVLFDNQPVAITRSQLPSVLFAQVPVNAAPGRHFFAVSDGQMQARAPMPFNVVGFPTIVDFMPKSGGPGTRVTIRGTGLTATTRVFYGNLECQVVQSDPRGSSLVAIIPDRATGKAFLWVQEGDHKERSAEQFFVQ